MTLQPDNRALRALLWFIILVVPGGFILLAFFAAEAVQRRYQSPVALRDPNLSDASLSRIASQPHS